jgi:hypothetical protein
MPAGHDGARTSRAQAEGLADAIDLQQYGRPPEEGAVSRAAPTASRTGERDQDITLPINVSGHDFYGGVILGLFGDKVGEAIIKKIFG